MMTSYADILLITSFGLGLFGAVFCALQDRDVWSFRALALVLLLSSLSELDEMPFAITDVAARQTYDIATALIWLFAVLALAPLFWHYVCTLTSVTPRLPERLWLHVMLPGAAVLLGLSVIAMPHDARLGLFIDGYDLPTGWPLVVGYIGEVLSLFVILQWGAYFVAILFRLRRYRMRLHQYVASTARKELTWIWLLGLAVIIYWCVNAADVYFGLTRGEGVLSDIQDEVLALALLLIVMLFGLQQRPGLAPDVVPSDASKKYEKSALTAEMSKRIERKLRQAMTDDALHHDPNLSLWMLAKHIGASPNYVSQTLNDNIGESFFDFVNGYRIADAQSQLRDGEETVLTIAYEVGFNSRSSFYTAFNKVTGQTPTAYRQGLSVSAEPDNPTVRP